LLKIGKFAGRKESIMKIALGNDHVAIEMKKQIKEYLIKKVMKLRILEPIHLLAATIPFMEK